MTQQRVLLYTSNTPFLDFTTRAGGVRRSWGIIVKGLEQAGYLVRAIDRNEYFALVSQDLNKLRKIEQEHDIIHCDDKEILKDMLIRDVLPTAYGYHPKGPGQKEPPGYWKNPKQSGVGILTGETPANDCGGLVIFPGYKDNPAQLYDDIRVWRHNPGQDIPTYWDKVHYFRPGIDFEFIPSPKKRKYVLWAGPQKSTIKGRDIFEAAQELITLPEPLEWKILTNYDLEDFLEILDETFLLVNISAFESHCFQLFEAWSKEVPTLYRPSTWGWEEDQRFHGKGPFFPKYIALRGVGGFHYQERTAECIAKRIAEICKLDKREVYAAGMLSQRLTAKHYSMQRFADDLIEFYQGTNHVGQILPSQPDLG